jgi:flavin reductase (NADH)
MSATMGPTVGVMPSSLLRTQYVDAMAGLASGVTIITTVDTHGTPQGLTTTSAVSVSADPPIVSVALGAQGRTLPAIRRSGGFCVNILRPSGRKAAQVFASRIEHKFQNIGWQPGPGRMPWFPGLSSHALYCELLAEIPAGDHVVILGRVHTICTSHAGKECDGSLVYWRRQWRELV